MIIRCSACGNEIPLADEYVGAVQCKCGAVIPNGAAFMGKTGFFTVPDFEKLRAQQRRNAKGSVTLFLIIYNVLLLILIGGLVFLVNAVDSVIPLYTVIPVIIFMGIGEVIFLLHCRRVVKRMSPKP